MSSRSDFISKRRRAAIYRRDSYECLWCTEFVLMGALTIDHVVPRSHGGTHATRNLITACLPCNSRRGNQSIYMFAVLNFADPASVIMRVLRATEKPILILHTSRTKRKMTRGQMSMVLREGDLK